jgi:hypothetical protein
MGSKRTLPWSSSFPSSQENRPSIKRQRSSQSSQFSSQPSSSYNSRHQPIVIDDSDDELYDEIFSTPLLPELDNYLSIGYMGIVGLRGRLISGSKVVGVQYYRGIATMDENLLLVREPRNQYDRNAIRVDNVANIQVGQSILL